MEKWNEDIVVAILTSESVKDTAERLIREKQQELSAFEQQMKEQTENARLINAGLKQPEGTARRMADAILAEMRENYPDAAARADNRIRAKRAAEERELDRLANS